LKIQLLIIGLSFKLRKNQAVALLFTQVTALLILYLHILLVQGHSNLHLIHHTGVQKWPIKSNLVVLGQDKLFHHHFWYYILVMPIYLVLHKILQTFHLIKVVMEIYILKLIVIFLRNQHNLKLNVIGWLLIFYFRKMV